MSPPSRSRQRGLFSLVSVLFLALLAVLCLCPPAVSAEDAAHPEYGTVIGIGLWFFLSQTSYSPNDASLDLGTTYADSPVFSARFD